MGKKYQKYISKNIDISKFKNKNIFITGGNSGLGFELAKYCASFGANIFLLCRSLRRAEIAKEDILKEYPGTKVEILKLDLASLSSIEQCVEKIKKLDVDIFVNNAGVYRLPKSLTKDGFEITMGTNFLGTLYLNDLLMSYFKSLKHDVRVLFETSITSKLTSIDVNDMFMDKKYNEVKIYAKSKVGVNSIYFTLCKENKDAQNIYLSLAHPGATYTPLIKKGYQNKVFEFCASLFMKIFFHSPEKACLCLLKALSSESKTCEYGPRGFLSLSGYPHHFNIKPTKNIDELMTKSRILLCNKKEEK